MAQSGGAIGHLLPYWSLNITRSWNAGLTWWPGFQYDEAERLIMRGLAERVHGRFWLFALAATLLFVPLAASSIFAGLLPLLARLYPFAAYMSPIVFMAMTATLFALLYGVGMPLCLAAAALLTDAILPRANVGAPLSDNERHVLAKLRGQTMRLALVGLAILAPLTLLAILFDVALLNGLPARIVQVGSAALAGGATLYIVVTGIGRR